MRYSDKYTRFFFAELRKRKMNSYVYSLNDDHRRRVIGFDEVAKVMSYSGILSRVAW